MEVISQKRLKEVLKYEPDTGNFFWLDKPHVPKNTPAGCHDKKGYMRIFVDGREYRAGRLAFLYMYGRFPYPCVDHINGIRDDDRIENLREVTNRQNLQNKAVHRAGRLPGAQKDRGGKWRSECWNGSNRRFLGIFATEQEAHKAYMAACKEAEGGVR
jgi:hypothetical protein